MRLSRYFMPILRDDPKEAEIVSHKLMLRAGMIRQEAAGPGLQSVVVEFLTDAQVAQNLLVLRTLPAHASSLARALDQAAWPEIVGTIAGDDTVFVATADQATAEAIRQKLLKFVS